MLGVCRSEQPEWKKKWPLLLKNNLKKPSEQYSSSILLNKYC